MKTLVIGADGGAHALGWKLAQSPAVTDLYTAPGNYGTNLIGANVHLTHTDVDTLAEWAKEAKIDLTVLASPAAALYGAVDVFREAGLRITGPVRETALLTAQRQALASFLLRHDIADLAYEPLGDAPRAVAYLEQLPPSAFPLVLSRDASTEMRDNMALAPTLETALAIVRRWSSEQSRLVPLTLGVEPYRQGPLIAVSAVSDGTTTRFAGAARLYLRAEEDDSGLLTAGMGAVSPPTVAQQQLDEIVDRLIGSLLAALAQEGRPYIGPVCVEGVLLDGRFTLTDLHFDFGPLAAQVVLPRWEDDLYIVLDAALDGAVAELRPFRWNSTVTCAVVMASEGYPEHFETGYGVIGLGDVGSGTLVFHQHTRTPFRRGADPVSPKIERNSRNFGRGLGSWIIPSRGRAGKVDAEATRSSGDPYSQVVTAGGQVVSVVGKGKSMGEARAAAYRGVEAIVYTGRWWRQDIGAEAP